MIKRKIILIASSLSLLAMSFMGVSLVTAAGPNLVPNQSVETVSGSLPANWNQGKWGTNTASFNYLTSGCLDGARCLSVTMSGYSSGDAKWYFTPVPVAPNTQYAFSSWYQSGVATDVNAVISDTAGNTSYLWLGRPAATTAWKQLNYTFTTPANAAKVTIYHVIAKNGTLKTDNFNLATTVAPTPSTSTSPTPTPSPANIVPNPSFETANGSAPASWSSSSWGTNTANFQYLTTGYTGNRSARVTVSGYTSGAANWAFTEQAVAPGLYQFTDWYQSTVSTEIDAAVTMSDGTVQYFWLASVPASSTWAQARAQFTVPAGAAKVTIYHMLAANGSLTTDDYSFSSYAPTGFSRGLISVTFDDGWTNQYTNGLPILTKYGIPSTFYILSGELTNQPAYMAATQVKNLYTKGHEIGSHTVTHPDLTTVSLSQLTTELSQSKSTLQNLTGSTISSFAYPYGAYNSSTIPEASKYYATQRTVDSGYNTKDSFNASGLKVQNVYASTTPAEVQSWINQAKQTKTWLILVYHEIANTPTDPSNADYTTRPDDLDAEMAAVKNSGLGVVTIKQAMSELTPQL